MVLRKAWALLVPIIPALFLVTVPAACGTTPADTTAGTAPGVATSSTTTSGPPEDTTETAPPALPGSPETIMVEVQGESWVVPKAVCLSSEGDADLVLAAARRQADTVEHLVGAEISGWPTTTYKLLTDEERAAWRQKLRTAGVTALALAGLVGQQAAIERQWTDYELSYADSDEGWGPPDAISSRVPEWEAEAQALIQAIEAYCSAE